jgi:hypothetical protein
MGIFIKDLAKEGMSLQEYSAHVDSWKDDLPTSAYEYAKAIWHYDMRDARCIHDAWLASCVFQEASLQKPHAKPTGFGIEISFLTGLEDRVLKFSYKNIVHYSLESPSQSETHSEVYFDEIRLSERKNMIHEILFMSNARWIIESNDFSFSFS